MVSASKSALLKDLQCDILRMQGFKPMMGKRPDLGLRLIEEAFPQSTFPTGAVHEFLADTMEDRVATCGFVAALLSHILGDGGTILWISPSRTIYPPALSNFGLTPDHILFTSVRKEKDLLWAADEALKCAALSAVVCEVKCLDFMASRRLQLAVEESQVTGFVLRSSKRVSNTASVSRWRIKSLPSQAIDDLPGVGFPRWSVELLRVRNGRPGSWEVQWSGGKFELTKRHLDPEVTKRKVG